MSSITTSENNSSSKKLITSITSLIIERSYKNALLILDELNNNKDTHIDDRNDNEFDINTILQLDNYYTIILVLQSREYLRKGDKYFHEQKYKKAKKQYNKINLDICPKLIKYQTYHNYGITLYHLGEENESLNKLEMALALMPDCIVTLECIATIQAALGRYVESLSTINECLKKSNQQKLDDYHIVCAKAMILNRLGRYSDANEISSNAIISSPERHNAFLVRGESRNKLYLKRDAEIDINKAKENKQLLTGTYNDNINNEDEILLRPPLSDLICKKPFQKEDEALLLPPSLLFSLNSTQSTLSLSSSSSTSSSLSSTNSLSKKPSYINYENTELSLNEIKSKMDIYQTSKNDSNNIKKENELNSNNNNNNNNNINNNKNDNNNNNNNNNNSNSNNNNNNNSNSNNNNNNSPHLNVISNSNSKNNINYSNREKVKIKNNAFMMTSQSSNPSLTNSLVKTLSIPGTINNTNATNNSKTLKEDMKEDMKEEIKSNLIPSTKFTPKIIASKNTYNANITNTANITTSNITIANTTTNAVNNTTSVSVVSNTTTSEPESIYNSSLNIKKTNNFSQNISNPINQKKSVKSLAMKVESKIPPKGNYKIPVPLTNEKKQTWNASANFAPMSRITPDLSNSPIKSQKSLAYSQLNNEIYNSDIDYSNTNKEENNNMTNNLSSNVDYIYTKADKPSRHYKPISPQLNDKNTIKLVIEVPPFNNESLTNNELYYPLKSLQNHPYPSNIDVKNREKYLNNDEFHNVFKMGKKEFDILPVWKKMQIKKSVGLF